MKYKKRKNACPAFAEIITLSLVSNDSINKNKYFCVEIKDIFSFIRILKLRDETEKPLTKMKCGAM